MSEISEARARSKAREAEREKARQQRKEEAATKRTQRSRSSSVEAGGRDDNMAAAGWDRQGDRERQAAKAQTAGSGVFAPHSHPPSKEDQVLAHAAQLQAENKETLKHTIKVARETTQVGAATIHKLDEQTEQFQRMDNTLTETQDTLTRSERIIRGMKSWGGTLGQHTAHRGRLQSALCVGLTVLMSAVVFQATCSAVASRSTLSVAVAARAAGVLRTSVWLDWKKRTSSAL